MNIKAILIPVISSMLFASCDQPGSHSATPKKTVDQHMVDSMISSSDSSYAKPYKRTDFVTVFFYVNKKDSSVCQLMKDSSGTIRQIIIARKNIRKFFAGYYANGQLQADLPLDESGQYHGTAVYYYQNGTVKSRGEYVHGFNSGIWKNYNERGELSSTDEYDINGQLIKTIKN